MLFEQFLAHATLRQLADDLAASGFSVLRFDYRAYGDSTGSPADLDDVESWLSDIASAVDYLRGRGATWVGLVGMRFGANLLATASERTRADACVLWDPVESGRALVRQATLLHRLTLEEDLDRSSPEPSPDQLPGLGFDYPDSFVHSLKAVKLNALTARARTVVFTRNGRLPSELRSRNDLELLAAIGQDELIDRPLTNSVVPEKTLSEIVNWLESAVDGRPPDRLDRTPLEPRCEVTLPNGSTILERTIRLGDIGLFGIVSEPSAAVRGGNALTCLCFNSGLQYHIGPHRLWVDISRRLASSGVEAIRFDLAGIGDSPTRHPYGRGHSYSVGALDDIDAVLADFAGRPVALVGLCSGGYHVLEAAARYPVRGVVSVHAAMSDSGLNVEATDNDPRRAVFVPDRLWLRRLARDRLSTPDGEWKKNLTIALAWRFPAVGWRLLDLLHLQPDVGRGWLRAHEQGAEVVILIEHRRLQYPRAWAFRQRELPGNIVVIPSHADHSLFDSMDRLLTADLICAYVRRWAVDPLQARASISGG